MPIVECNGVTIAFPFDPYPSQLKFMSSVTAAVCSAQHALLESPTGTGKTLCLLCSLLAWQQSQSASLNGEPQPEGIRTTPVIYYASRTHSQLAQVVRELKKTSYRPRMVVLGSREQMCVNEQVSRIASNSAQSALCGRLCAKQQCKFRTKVDAALTELSKLSVSERVMDLEELASFVKRLDGCPFFASRDLIGDADLVLLPYNYLLDRQSSLALSMRNAVVVIDEGHNIESFCCESYSVELTTDDFLYAAGELEDLLRAFETGQLYGEQPIDPNKVNRLVRVIQSMHKVFMSVDLRHVEVGDVKKMMQILEQSEINAMIASSIISDLGDVKQAVMENAINKGKSNRSAVEPIIAFLQAVYGKAEGAESTNSNNNTTTSNAINTRDFKMHIGLVDEKLLRGPRRVCFWCFNPGLAMRELQGRGLRSIILTSGTLSPLSSFASELQLHFGVQLENQHVISNSQMFVGICKHGPAGHKLSSSFADRRNDDIKQDLGSLVVRVAEQVPDGLLVFFPSYSVMTECVQFWQRATKPNTPSLMDKLKTVKHIVFEPKDRREMQSEMEKYYKLLEDKGKRGAVFFSICRGKVSEGLDFADKKGRAVIIAGLPYPPFKDPKVVLKMRYMNEQRAMDAHYLSGNDWYNQQASRAVNQAIGRVIRHVKDYGAIILADQRFAEPRVHSLLSKWLRPAMTSFELCEDMLSGLKTFFMNMSNKSVHHYDHHENRNTNSTLPVERYQPVHEYEEKVELTATKVNQHSEYSDLEVAMKALAPTAMTTTMKRWSSHYSKENATAYLDDLRSKLSAQQHKQFNVALKQYKAKSIDIQELLTKLTAVFEEANRLDLFDGFRKFVPEKHKPVFESHIKSLRKKALPADACTICERPCDRTKDKPFKAPCGHVACFVCWSARLRVAAECPGCGYKLRMTMLRKAF